MYAKHTTISSSLLRAILCCAALTASACSDDATSTTSPAPDENTTTTPPTDTPDQDTPSPDEDMDPPQGDMGTPDMEDPPEVDMGDPTPAVMQATRANIKFKGGRRYARELSRALNIAPQQLCNELGMFDCFEQVYRITLEGVEPEILRIWTPVEGMVTAPIAVDRIALHACEQRVSRDERGEDDAEVSLFAELATPDKFNTSQARAGAIERTFDRLLQRLPTADEAQRIQAFYTQVQAQSQAPGRDWAILTCFVSATMLETLHY